MSLEIKEYKHGFVTEVESEKFEVGLDEGVVREISSKNKSRGK